MNTSILHNLKIIALLIALAVGLGVAASLFRNGAGSRTEVSLATPPTETINAKTLGEIVTAEDLEQLIRKKANVLILDVRADWFYENDGHVPGAVNLERGEFDKLYPSLAAKISGADRVIVYCSDLHCKDSKSVAEKLRKLKHENVSLYVGGWEDWKTQKRRFNTGKKP